MSLTTEVMVIFVIFWPILAKIWLPWQRPLDSCNQKCLLLIGRPRKPPVISNQMLVISRRNAFIAILVPQLVAMVAPLCPLCTTVSHMNSLIAKSLYQNQTLQCMDISHTTDVMAILSDFWHIFSKNWLPWQRRLDPCHRKCLFRICGPQKPRYK